MAKNLGRQQKKLLCPDNRENATLIATKRKPLQSSPLIIKPLFIAKTIQILEHCIVIFCHYFPSKTAKGSYNINAECECVCAGAGL